jgi:uracil-DNA glycosylase family 4
MPYDLLNCQKCPYLNQAHLPDELRTIRAEPPVMHERHGSKTLIVGEAPGFEEWQAGAPFQAVKKIGGTAGARLEQSWKRASKCREDFDFINSVQCYPGKKGTRDARPNQLALCACTGRLASILKENKYERAICFGEASKGVVSHLSRVYDLSFEVVLCRHPTGGVRNTQLDAVW